MSDGIQEEMLQKALRLIGRVREPECDESITGNEGKDGSWTASYQQDIADLKPAIDEIASTGEDLGRLADPNDPSVAQDRAKLMPILHEAMGRSYKYTVQVSIPTPEREAPCVQATAKSEDWQDCLEQLRREVRRQCGGKA